MNETTGSRIRERRKALGLSTDELAELVGKSAPSIYRYESCNYDNIPLPLIDAFAPLLKTSVCYLMMMTTNCAPMESDLTAVECIRQLTAGSPVPPEMRRAFVNKKRFEIKLNNNLSRLSDEDLRSIFDYISFLASRHEDSIMRTPGGLIKATKQAPNKG